MPHISQVQLSVTERDKILNVKVLIRVGLTNTEMCIARTCLDAINRDYHISAVIHPVDFNQAVRNVFLATFHRVPLVFEPGNHRADIVFEKQVAKGWDLNEDIAPFQEDEIIALAELWPSGNSGSVLMQRESNWVTGFF